MQRSVSAGKLTQNLLTVITIEVPQLERLPSVDESNNQAMFPQEIARPASFLIISVIYWSFVSI